MNDKREGIGLPSSLVDDAIGSMNSDSHTASNNPVVPISERDVSVHTEAGQPMQVPEPMDNQDSFEKIDTLDPNRGSNVDRQNILDSSNTVDKFDSSSFDSGNLNEGLLSDTRGSTSPMMEQPVMAEQVGQIDFVKWFSELTNKDVASAGGKGASLGEMFSNKFPVPAGYVITAQAYDYYLKNAGLHDQIDSIIKELDVDDTAALNEASKKVRSLIEGGEIPNDLKEEILESYKILSSEDLGEVSPGVSSDALSILKNSQEPAFVSIRSSATTEDLADASFAGQQESFLNVKGDSSLMEHVKRCFSSLYTPRAIFYRKKKGFSGALIAVVVQKMVDSEKSGVVFSRDPVKQDDNIAMEAVFGLGEGIVSGKIHPDSYIVDRDLEIKDIKLANKKIAVVRNSGGSNEIVRLSEEKSQSQVLSRAEIKEVADFAIKLEDHYGKPQDIEFALESGEVYIIQSRPITTLGNKQEGKELEGTVLVEGLAASPGVGVGNVRIVKGMEDLVNVKKGDVMVTEMTNPDMVVSMQKSVAIVTDEGGMTSHAAIVSREMGIPAIVGTSEATSKLKDGSKVTVDGFNGKVFEGEVAQTTMAEIKEVVETSKVKMKVIVDLPDYAERAAESKIDSVGLTRLEGMIASMGKHPLWYEKQGKLDEYSKILEEGLGKIAKSFNSVWVRASDIRTDEFANLEGAPEREINPMLGFHGVRFSLKHPEILKAEITAIKEVAERNPDKKIGLMFPQIISMEEVLAVKKYFDEFRTDNMEFGVMIETPASVQIIEEICDHVDFISFGTNDLTQFTLAVDRGEDMVQHLYNELHPAIFSQIGHVIDVCNRKGVVSSICGQAGSKPEMAKFLYEKGIKSISVNADAAHDISVVISDLEKSDTSSEEVQEDVSSAVLEQPSEPVVEEVEQPAAEEPVVEQHAIAQDNVEGPVVEEVQEPVVEEAKEDWGTKGQISVAEVAPVVEEVKEDIGSSNEETRVNQPVVQEVNEESKNNNAEISDEERKRLKKKKKWEKFMKWKAKKKAEKAAKRAAEQNKVEEKVEEKVVEDSNEKHGWGKQGEVALPDSGNHQVIESEEKMEVSQNENVNTDEQRAEVSEGQEVVEEVREDEKQFNEEVQEENPYEDNLLNPESIGVSAESEVSSEDAGEVLTAGTVSEDTVSPVDNLDHIREAAKDIAEEVKEDNLEAIEKRHEAEDRIEVEIEKPDELKEDEQVETMEEKMERLEDDDVEEKTVDQYVNEDEPNVPAAPEQTEEEKAVNEEVQEIVGEEESERSEEEAYGETPSEYSSESDGAKEEIEEEAEENDSEESEEVKEEPSEGGDDEESEGGDGGEQFSEIGVYNPDEGEEKSEEKSKYNYNFDSWEDY